MDFSYYQRYDITQDEFDLIKQYFAMFDAENTGTVSPEDIKKALKGNGQEIANESIYQQICTLCSEGKGQLTFEEFLPLMTPKILKHSPQNSALQLISLIDDQKTGFITAQSLRQAMQSAQIEASEQILEQMLKLADKDKDQMVGVQELQDLLDSLARDKK